MNTALLGTRDSQLGQIELGVASSVPGPVVLVASPVRGPTAAVLAPGPGEILVPSATQALLASQASEAL